MSLNSAMLNHIDYQEFNKIKMLPIRKLLKINTIMIVLQLISALIKPIQLTILMIAILRVPMNQIT